MAGSDWHLVLTLKKPVPVPPRKCWFLRWCQMMTIEKTKKLAGYVFVLIVFWIMFVIARAATLPVSGPYACALPRFNPLQCLNPWTFVTNSSCFNCLTGGISYTYDKI